MVPATLQRRLEELAPRFGIRLALVFGSAVTGALHGRSDFDLALLFDDPQLDFNAFAELQHELQESLPGQTLDLAIINHADPLFLHQITKSCELAYGRPMALRELELYAFRRYQDHRRFLQMERDYVRRLVEGSGAA